MDGSLQALGVEQLFALLLHANDPRTPFEEQLGTLAELKRQGKIAHLGLCNVSIAEVRQAQRHFSVCAMQNELSAIDRKSVTEGLVALAADLLTPTPEASAALAPPVTPGGLRQLSLGEDPATNRKWFC